MDLFLSTTDENLMIGVSSLLILMGTVSLLVTLIISRSFFNFHRNMVLKKSIVIMLKVYELTGKRILDSSLNSISTISETYKENARNGTLFFQSCIWP